MKAPVLLVLVACLVGVALPAWAQTQMDPGPLQRCRAISEAAARLACYDAIALPGAGASASPATGTAPAAAPATVPAATPAGPDAIATFGMERRIAESAPDRLDSRLAGAFDGWEPNSKLTLENGQVWQVVDGSRAYYGQLDKPKASVTRGMLGSFYLQIEGVSQTPRVRRVK